MKGGPPKSQNMIVIRPFLLGMSDGFGPAARRVLTANGMRIEDGERVLALW